VPVVRFKCQSQGIPSGAAGYTTAAFTSGREFIDKYDPSVAGCLVLDISMPGMTGLDAHQWLITSGIPLPVIFLPAQSDLPARMQGVVDVLTKPVTASTLIACIERAFAGQRRARKP
jgi:FixJ family two-component response regulator